jgi:periplasmic protein TonB
MKTIFNFKKIVHVKVLIGMLLAICILVVVSCDQKRLAKSETSSKYQMIDNEKVYQEVDQMPEYPGGTLEMQKYLVSSVKYPVDAMKNKIQGKVFVSFVVGKDGVVKNVTIARGADPLLDAEALRVVKSFPKWIPGKEKGKIVAVQYTVPINFVLQ